MGENLSTPRIVEFRVRMNTEQKLLEIEADVLLHSGTETVSLHKDTYGDEGEAGEIIGDKFGKSHEEVHELAEKQHIKKLCSAT